MIGFDLGLLQLALTPDFLDNPANIMTAHRAVCNKQAELDLGNAIRLLHSMGVTDLPSFLPVEIRSQWKTLHGLAAKMPTGRSP